MLSTYYYIFLFIFLERVALATFPSHSLGPYSTVIRPMAGGMQYAIEVKFNGVPRYLLIDTGSSDTWMFAPDVECVTTDGTPKPADECAFGELYAGPYITPIKDINYNQVYGNGDVLNGYFGYAHVEVAGITLPHQQIALVNKASWSGNGVLSGVIGLASRALTAEYPGSNPEDDTIGEDMIQYPTVFESMYNQTKQIDPVFSLALRRGQNAGYLSFGGLPPINVTHNFATTQFTGVLFEGQRPADRYYPIQPENYTLNGEVYETNYTAIVDSGTYVCRFPTDMADRINAAFDPPAVYNETLGFYITTQNATVPELGISIGGKTFNLNSSDIFPFICEGEICATNIARGFDFSDAYPEGFFVLGDVFLHNVVAVFDVGRMEMKIAASEDY